MRKSSFVVLAATTCLISSAACQISSATEANHRNPNPELYRKDARPFGVDMETWAERLTQWIYRQPLEANPVLDQTGEDCAVDQDGPVWFIPPIDGPPVFSGTRTCTIPRHKAILLDIGNGLAMYPRPTIATYQPNLGETLHAFLARRVDAVMDTVDFLAVSLDGRELEDVLSYRFVSKDLFELIGDLSIKAAYDSRILGWGMPAVSDGFFMMFKPLRPGPHVIIVRGTNTFGDNKTYTYYLNVE